MGRLNYIAWFISQMTAKCDPIFKMLRKHNSGEWDEECQKAFDKVKEYLTNPPMLVPRYSPLENMCYALAWAAQRLRQYMFYHTTWLIAELDPIKFIFEKPSLSERIVR